MKLTWLWATLLVIGACALIQDIILGYMYVIAEDHIAIMIDWEQMISGISRGKPNR